VLGVVANEDFGAKRTKGGYRIRVAKVAAGHLVTHANQDSRDATHSRTTYADKVHGS
jgi:hypothetical protein